MDGESKKFRKKISHYIFTVAYRDRILCETVSRCDRTDIAEHFELPSGFLWGDLPDVGRGDVMLDGRGRGTFQK